MTLEGENRLQKPDMVSEDILIPPNKDERGLLKAMVLSTVHEKKWPRPGDGATFHLNVSPVSHSTISVSNSQAEYQQLSQRVERLERIFSKRQCCTFGFNSSNQVFTALIT
ncbi:hypothetical protein OIU84_000742 [Salix udensis]|uniref:Uncharacterized protein n=1 Tax=Salix udensis TaxID=889485 RepID=A0AAD6L5E8_9ROSI|nr:hypothetical protein OIU84_000742 [Salix udensis]